MNRLVQVTLVKGRSQMVAWIPEPCAFEGFTLKLEEDIGLIREWVVQMVTNTIETILGETHEA